VPLLGKKSGFRTVRDLILFITGLSICIFHIVTTPPAHLSVPLLLFGGGMAGVPAILKQDERRE
jgi:hypothetical protein